MKNFCTVLLLLAISPLAVPAVMNAGPNGFEVEHEVVISKERAAVWKDAINVGAWWHSGHTISGDAARMSIDAKPQGCFCENLGGNDGVVHLTVTSVDTDIMLRLTGGLGPLGVMGVTGNMMWQFSDHEQGTLVKFTYAVGGFRSGGLNALALPVDGVISEALERLKVFAEGGDPDSYDGE